MDEFAFQTDLVKSSDDHGFLFVRFQINPSGVGREADNFEFWSECTETTANGRYRTTETRRRVSAAWNDPSALLFCLASSYAIRRRFLTASTPSPMARRRAVAGSGTP
jgi:hypothetical protein